MTKIMLDVRYERPVWQRLLPVFLAAITLPGNFMRAVDQRSVRIEFFSRDSSFLLEGEQAAIYWWLGVALMLGFALAGTYLLFRNRSIVMTPDCLTVPRFLSRRGRHMRMVDVEGLGIRTLKHDQILYVFDGVSKPISIKRSWIEDHGAFERLVEELKAHAPRIAA